MPQESPGRASGKPQEGTKGMPRATEKPQKGSIGMPNESPWRVPKTAPGKAPRTAPGGPQVGPKKAPTRAPRRWRKARGSATCIASRVALDKLNVDLVRRGYASCCRRSDFRAFVGGVCCLSACSRDIASVSLRDFRVTSVIIKVASEVFGVLRELSAT